MLSYIYLVGYTLSKAKLWHFGKTAANEMVNKALGHLMYYSTDATSPRIMSSCKKEKLGEEYIKYMLTVMKIKN